MKAGIKNIAYIRTNYQKRPLEKVLADVDKYYELYGKDNLSGFFFDEVGVDDANQPAYMKAVYEYVKGKGKENIVVANPGSQILMINYRKTLKELLEQLMGKGIDKK